MSFTTSFDIANRGLQHCGVPRIADFTDNSRQAAETGFCYDMLRVAELRRSTWRFATRRAMVRPLTATSLRFIPPVYASGTAYVAGQIVRDSAGVYWINLIGSTGVAPGTVTAGLPPNWTQYFGPVVADLWATGNTYNAGEIVYKAGPVFYISLENANTAHDPAVSHWVALAVGTSSAVVVPEPAGVGMTVGTRARNAYPLPNGYIRVLSPDPKVESTSTLETSAALRYLDWQFEGDYIISSSTVPLLLRFVADISHVPAMDALFCEGLAARIAYEVCETLTQSNIKLQAIGQAYQKFSRDARLINWLETGNTEPQEEEYELTKGPQGVAEAGAQPAQPGQG